MDWEYIDSMSVPVVSLLISCPHILDFIWQRTVKLVLVGSWQSFEMVWCRETPFKAGVWWHQVPEKAVRSLRRRPVHNWHKASLDLHIYAWIIEEQQPRTGHIQVSPSVHACSHSPRTTPQFASTSSYWSFCYTIKTAWKLEVGKVSPQISICETLNWDGCG